MALYYTIIILLSIYYDGTGKIIYLHTFHVVKNIYLHTTHNSAHMKTAEIKYALHQYRLHNRLNIVITLVKTNFKEKDHLD